MRFYSIIILVCLSFFACNEEANQEKMAILSGDWRGVAWTINGAPSSKTPRSAILRFSDDGQYLGDLGSKPERGHFVVSDNELKFTKADNTKFTSVIERLNQDTLVLNLSHRGNPEQITFVRRY